AVVSGAELRAHPGSQLNSLLRRGNASIDRTDRVGDILNDGGVGIVAQGRCETEIIADAGAPRTHQGPLIAAEDDALRRSEESFDGADDVAVILRRVFGSVIALAIGVGVEDLRWGSGELLLRGGEKL